MSVKTVNYRSTKTENTQIQTQIHRKPGNACQSVSATQLRCHKSPHPTGDTPNPVREMLCFCGGFPCDRSGSRLHCWFDIDTRKSDCRCKFRPKARCLALLCGVFNEGSVWAEPWLERQVLPEA